MTQMIIIRFPKKVNSFVKFFDFVGTVAKKLPKTIQRVNFKAVTKNKIQIRIFSTRGHREGSTSSAWNWIVFSGTRLGLEFKHTGATLGCFNACSMNASYFSWSSLPLSCFFFQTVEAAIKRSSPDFFASCLAALRYETSCEASHAVWTVCSVTCLFARFPKQSPTWARSYWFTGQACVGVRLGCNHIGRW